MKNLVIATLLLFLAACATTRQPIINPYSYISVENVKKTCKSTELWNVGVLGLYGLVMRFDDCLNVKVLLAIATDSDVHSDQIKRSSIDLLAMHYMEYLKQEEEPTTDEEKANKKTKKIYSIKKIKEEGHEEWFTYFFEITYKTIECSTGTCMQKD